MSASPPHAENDSEQQLQLVGGDTDNDDRPDQSRGRHESEEPQGGIPGRSGAHRDDRSTSPDRRRVPPALRTPFEDDNLSKFADDLQSEAPLRFSTPKRIGPAFQEELVMSSAHGGKLAQVQAPGDVDTKEAVAYGAAPSLALPVTLEGLEHPYNWPARRKWLITLQAALLIFSSTITSSAPSGGSVVFQQEYGINSTVAELLVSVFLLGYVVGPFITAPSTEAYGRRWPSIACMALYTIFNGACAGCSSITPLLVCRFFAGMWASGPISTSASIVTDIWVPKDRNFVMSIWSIGSFSGPALGPVVGGFISVSGLPTRWIFIVKTILTGAMTLFIACCLPETYEPELVKRKMARLQKEAGLSRTLSQTSRKSQGREDFWQTLKTLLTRPFILFVNEPLLILSTLYSSFAYAVLYLLFPLYPIIFREIHGIQPGLADLPFVAILIGVVSAISVTHLFQRKYVRDLKRAGGKHTPELRLPPAFAGGPIMLVSLLWLGWTGNTARISPYAPAFSGVLTGLASVLIFRSFSSYVIECYKAYGASAMATLVIWRSLFAAGLPLAVAPMVRSLGVGWTATLLAGFQATLIPIPFLFYRYGPVIRQRSKYSQDD